MIVHETLGLVASAIVLVLTALVFWTLNRYLGAYKARLDADGDDQETRRFWKRRQYQMFGVVGVWEISIGFLLVGAMGDVTSGLGPTMVGAGFLGYALFWPRIDRQLEAL